jgi:CMP-N,N'-diacetyllegionaminic acid synthase
MEEDSILGSNIMNESRMNPDMLDKIEYGVTYAVIPARSGSKGIVHKNLRCIQGYPLMAYAIAVAKLSKCIDRIIVSTDSDHYAKIASYYGAEVPFLRPAKYATDTSEDIDFIEHAINWCYRIEGTVPEFIAQVRPTVPFRKSGVIDDAIKAMKKDDTADSLQSAHIMDCVPYKSFLRDDAGYYHPLFPGMTLDDVNKSRHTFPDAYMADGYIDVLRTRSIITTNTLHGTKMIGFITSEGIDIDNNDDFKKCEELIKGRDCEVLNYLKENYKRLSEIEQ